MRAVREQATCAALAVLWSLACYQPVAGPFVPVSETLDSGSQLEDRSDGSVDAHVDGGAENQPDSGSQLEDRSDGSVDAQVDGGGEKQQDSGSQLEDRPDGSVDAHIDGGAENPPDSGASGSAPAVSCARVDGGSSWVVASEGVPIDCTLESPGRPVSWSVEVDPPYAVIDDSRLTNAGGRLWATWRGDRLPQSFGDTTARVVVKARFSDVVSPEGNARVDVSVVGNFLAADFDGTVDWYTSDLERRGTFLSLTSGVKNPSLLVGLRNGNILVGMLSSAGGKPLQEFDRDGRKIRDFAVSDPSSTSLWPVDSRPSGGIHAADGSIWIALDPHESGENQGRVYRFDEGGAFLEELPPPTDLSLLQIRWRPGAIAQLSDGTMVIASHDKDTRPLIAVYPSGTTSATHVELPFQKCARDGLGPVTCSQTSDRGGGARGLAAVDGLLAVTLRNSNGDRVAIYSEPSLTFVRSSVETSQSMYRAYGTIIGQRPGFVVAGDYSSCIRSIDPEPLIPVPGAETCSQDLVLSLLHLD